MVRSSFVLLALGAALCVNANSFLQGAELESADGAAFAEVRACLGMPGESIYGLPCDPDLWTVPERMPHADENRFLPDLYRALWGDETGCGRRGIADDGGNERQRFLEEYYDAIAIPGDKNCSAERSHRCGRRSEPLSWLHWFH